MNLTRIDALSRRKIVLAAGGLAALLRLSYWAFATPDRPLLSDAHQYHKIATNIAEGRGFVDTFPQIELHATAFRPPLYPGLLGFIYRVFWPSPGIGRLCSVIIGTAVVMLLAALVYRWLGPRAAIAAGLTAAISPNLIANDTYVLTEPLSLLLLLALLSAVLNRSWLPAGVWTGLLVLTRPSAQYLILIFAVWFFVTLGWKRAGGYVVMAGLVVTPWVLRNWAELGSPVLVTSNGFNLAAIYSPPADEAGHFIDPVAHPYFDDERLTQFDEIVWERRLREIAVDNITDDPAILLRVVSRNFLAYFEIHPWTNEQAERFDGRHMGTRQATLWIFYVTVIAGLAGFWRRRREPLVIASVLIAGYFTAASLVSVAPPRLRAPTDLTLAIGVGALFAVAAKRQTTPESSLDTSIVAADERSPEG